jgi:hypothetical protein
MNKRLIGCIVLVAVGVLSLGRFVFLCVYDINAATRSSKRVTGKVIYADTRKIERFSLRRNSYITVFYFTLSNSDQHFAVHRNDGIYNDLEAAIKPGDTVSVYYLNSTSEYNRRVLQVEKKRKILSSIDDYRSYASRAAALMLGAGLLLTIVPILWYRKFSLTRFLNSLVK